MRFDWRGEKPRISTRTILKDTDAQPAGPAEQKKKRKRPKKKEENDENCEVRPTENGGEIFVPK